MLVSFVCLGLASPAQPFSAAQLPFSAAQLTEAARRLAEQPFVAPSKAPPEALQRLGEERAAAIAFRPEASLWRQAKLPFELRLMHLGAATAAPIAVYLVDHGHAERLSFDPAMFDYSSAKLSAPLAADTGFAGLVIAAPAARLDSALTLVGGSHFRALGQDTVAGPSSAALAIDTAAPSGEILPEVRELYVEKPKRSSKSVIVYALLDSSSATGAFAFELQPGVTTDVVVTATVFLRKRVERLGLAPLASMYLYGENDRGSFDDYRPEVHDSDGLLIWFGNGERLWRPLQNPAQLELSAFSADAVKGFGLMQRDRAPSSYEDLDTRYERKASVWIEPLEGFGRGQVYLIELPSREESHDNVIAFFSPAQMPEPGVPLRLAYRMRWGADPTPRVTGSATVATRSGQGGSADARHFVIDFTSPSAPSSRDVEVVVTAGAGVATNERVQTHATLRGYRAVFDFLPVGKGPFELRCFLRQRAEALSETWSYRWEGK